MCSLAPNKRNANCNTPRYYFVTYQIGKNPKVAETPPEVVKTRATGNGGPGNGAGGHLVPSCRAAGHLLKGFPLGLNHWLPREHGGDWGMKEHKYRKQDLDAGCPVSRNISTGCIIAH